MKYIKLGLTVFLKVVSGFLIGGIILGILAPEVIRFADSNFEKAGYVLGNKIHALRDEEGRGCIESYIINASKYDNAIRDMNKVHSSQSYDKLPGGFNQYHKSVDNAFDAYIKLKRVYSLCSGVGASESTDRERLEYLENILLGYQNVRDHTELPTSRDLEIIEAVKSECFNYYKHVSSDRKTTNDNEKYNTFNHIRRAADYHEIGEICIGVELKDPYRNQVDQTFINGVRLRQLINE